MDYASYRRWRDEIIAARPDVRRLDCMNPEKALAVWEGSPVAAAPAEVADLPGAWARATGQSIPEDQLIIGCGVRDLLEATFGTLGGELWLPEDVYPVYWELARGAGLAPRSFATLATAGWSFLTDSGARATALLPIPLTPLGRWPSADELAALARWLRAGEARSLLVDAVYTYDFCASNQVLGELIATGRCAVFWSCSKSWLRRDLLGFGRVPREWARALRSRLAPIEPGSAQAWLAARPELPARQARAFAREWERLAPSLAEADRSWRPPETGYFSAIPRSYDRLLAEHAILAVPASVFGAADDRVSVISCLHDLAAHERETQR